MSDNYELFTDEDYELQHIERMCDNCGLVTVREDEYICPHCGDVL